MGKLTRKFQFAKCNYLLKYKIELKFFLVNLINKREKEENIFWCLYLPQISGGIKMQVDYVISFKSDQMLDTL